MYFLVALGMTLISLCLFLFVKPKKVKLHFDILAIIFGAATLMWLIDCIASAINGEGFLSFEIPLDIWISIWVKSSHIFVGWEGLRSGGISRMIFFHSWPSFHYTLVKNSIFLGKI